MTHGKCLTFFFFSTLKKHLSRLWPFEMNPTLTPSSAPASQHAKTLWKSSFCLLYCFYLTL